MAWSTDRCLQAWALVRLGGRMRDGMVSSSGGSEPDNDEEGAYLRIERLPGWSKFASVMIYVWGHGGDLEHFNLRTPGESIPDAVKRRGWKEFEEGIYHADPSEGTPLVILAKRVYAAGYALVEAALKENPYDPKPGINREPYATAPLKTWKNA